jgi:hypothetical protein
MLISSALIGNQMQLASQHFLDESEILDLRIEIFVVKVQTAFVHLLEYVIYFTRGPITAIAYFLPSFLEITLLGPSSALEFAPEFSDLLLLVRAHRYEPVRCVKDKSQAVAVAKVAASAKAGQCFDMCAVFREVACEFGEGEEIVGNRGAHQFDVL